MMIPYLIRGTTKPFIDSLETNFDINFENVDIPHYLAYIPVKINFSVPSGFLDTRLQLSFRQYKDRTPSLGLKGDLTISKLVVNDARGQKIIDLPAVKVTSRSIEPLAKKIELSRVSIESPELAVVRGRNGDLNILKLIPESNEETRDKKTSEIRQANASTEKSEENPLQLLSMSWNLKRERSFSPIIP